MASTFTPNASIEKPAHGDDIDTWDIPVNSDWDIIDAVFGNTTSLNAVAASGIVALTVTQYRPRNIVISGLLTASVNYQIPSGVGGQWTIFNNTTGAFSVTFSSAGGGTSVVLLQGYRTLVVSDGTNISVSTTAPLNAAGADTYVQYNGGGLFSGSSNFTFDATAGRVSASGYKNNLVSLLDPSVAILSIENGAGAAGQFCYSGSTSGVVSLSTRVQSTIPIPFAVLYQGLNIGGITTNGSTITVYGTSDGREKDIEGEYDPGDLFDRVRIYNYRWKTGDKALGIGPIAQELYTEAPNLVAVGDTESDSFETEGYKAWRSHVSEPEAMIMAELKSLRARVAELESK